MRSLARLENVLYSIGVPATAGTKAITLGNLALQRQHGAFFMSAIPSMAGCVGHPQGWSVPDSDCDNPAQPATSLLSPAVGGLLSKSGVRIMAIDQPPVLPSVESVKRCKKCGEEKPLIGFSKDLANKDGLQRRCKVCCGQDLQAWKDKDPDTFKKQAAVRHQAYREKNREKWLAQKKAYRLANKERLAAKLKEYNDNHKEKRAAYASKNKDAVRKSQAKYRVNNKTKVREARIAWEKTNPEKVSALKRNRRARKRNAEGSHTAADIQQLLVLQKNKCAVCHISIAKSYHVDHVIPLALNGSNSKDNLQLLCPSCNLSKNAQHPVDFMQSRGMLL